jgi:ectoine hydroxylase-related dioxygenase (phytanoyl-CoA dioxygenase family)
MSFDQVTLADNYRRDGFVSPVRLLKSADAAAQRTAMESVEAEHGPLHYISKVHTLLDFAADLATDERVLDAVEAVLGPDIMLFDVTYIVKEPNQRSHVSWHQDLTYWGFSSDEQVSMWLALSPATEESGCMRMLPGSHAQGPVGHEDVSDPDNVLYRGQTVKDVAEERAVHCPLAPGEASFHHGWTLHASMPNMSDDRRIGFNVQFIAPSVEQRINRHETATLVRGEDRYGHYAPDVLATGVMDADAVERHAELDARRKQTWASA